MTDEQASRSDYDTLITDAQTFRERVRASANRAHSRGEGGIAGGLFVLERSVYVDVNEIALAWLGTLEPVLEVSEAPAPAKRGRKPAAAAADGQPRCRHEWGAPAVAGGPPICTKCRAPKSAQGRKAAGALPTATVAGVTKQDPPSRSLPLDAAAAERFADGGSAGANAGGRR
jgi:hypothetical protein